jgi:hypothetical protein
MKICPVGAQLFHAYGRTDTTKLRVAFRSFATASETRTEYTTVYRILKLVCSLGLDSVLLTEGSFLGFCFDVCEQVR